MASLAALLAVLVGCTVDLLPRELVVPGELPALAWRGEPGAGLGAAVALDGVHVLAGAPGVGEVWRLDDGLASAGPLGLGSAVWWSGGSAWAARVSAGVFRVDGAQAEEVWATPGVRFFAGGTLAGEARVVGSDGARVWLWDAAGVPQAQLDQPSVQRLAVGAERVLILACPGEGCRALAWWVADGDLEDLGEAGDGGAIVELDGQAWWGLPALEDAAAPGEVCAEDGTCIAGIAGDHLGRSLCPGYAAGIFNTMTVPARLRIVPFAGGEVLAVDRAAPGRPAALDCDPTGLAVGLPAAGLHEPGEGEVLLIERP